VNPRSRLLIPSILLALLGIAAVIAAFLLHIDRTLFFRAYLFGYTFCLGLALGGLCLLMLHTLCGGDWGFQIRPIAHASAMTLPLLVLLFIPLCFGLQDLYPWARPDQFLHSHKLLHRAVYLNATFFYVRAAGYFLIWLVLAFLVNRRPFSRGLCAAGLILYLMTMTHAGFDWLMSRETDFYSTTFGFVLTTGQTLSAMALAIVLLPLLPKTSAPPSVPSQRKPLLNDIGNVLLTIVILWAYVSFMQLLVVWMGNTRDDNVWYLERGFAGGGDSFALRVVAILVLLCQFAIPFYSLLFRGLKQLSPTLIAIAWILLVGHFIEAWWLVAPSDHDGAAVFDPHWIDLAAFVALLGIWFTLFLILLRREKPVVLQSSLTPLGGAVAHD
jgi:hypothetical protein